MIVWRLVKASHAATAFDGEGAFLYGGRWNFPGSRVIYTSGSKSLALLEILVHLDPADAPKHWTAFQVQLEAVTIQKVSLPRDWRSKSQAIGDEWLRNGRALALAVPSVIVPEEFNYLVHPRHPDFSRLDLTHQNSFELDLRLIE